MRSPSALTLCRRRSAGLAHSIARLNLFMLFCVGCMLSGCEKRQAPAAANATPQVKTAAAPSAAVVPEGSGSGSSQGTLSLPIGFGKRTGDLDEMVKARSIRAILIVNPIGFFYRGGRPQGIQYEALEEFEKFVNHEMKTGKLPLKVDFLPMRPDQAEAALEQGLGDIIAQGVVVTPEREKRVAFSTPIQMNVSHVIVTGPALANVSSFDDMAAKRIYVNPVDASYATLREMNDARRKSGKPALDVVAADKDLFDDDLVEMVNAGLIPATVTTKERADLWAQVLPNVRSHPDLVVSSGESLAWVMRKDNPQFKALVDEFVQTHAVGTSFGNTLVRRYLQNTKWIKNSTTSAEIQKFDQYVEYFKRYASEYDFDYLMLAAQGYQESQLNQNTRSPGGAVGIMQVMPKLAAANPIDVPNVNQADANIHAAVKMMRNIADTYFNDPAIDPVDKTLFVFASYNAGPNRIAGLRKKAQQDGLNPNKWFGNVELEVAKDVGQVTVNYVDNIYKYYVAYKLTLADKLQQKAAEQKVN